MERLGGKHWGVPVPPVRQTYRNRPWNLENALGQGFEGAAAAVIGLIVVGATSLFHWWSDTLGAILFSLLLVGPAVTIVRTILGRVTVSDHHLHVRNPFRTFPIPLDRITVVGKSTVWQIAYYVTSLVVETPHGPKGYKVIPLPADDA